MSYEKALFDWQDPLFLDAQLTDAERLVRDSAADPKGEGQE